MQICLADIVIYIFTIYICIHVSKTNDVRLEKVFELFESSKYPQEGSHKENGSNIKLISIAHNAEGEMSLNSLSQLWSKIFRLPCTMLINI